MFRRLLSIEEAKEILKNSLSLKPKGTQRAPLPATLGRVLAKDVVAPIDVPPFDRSTVDGYAVRAPDTFGAEENRPVALRLCGCVSAGEEPSTVVGRGATVEIATGAPLPRGADAVVMLEYTVRKVDRISVYRPVSSGENVMEAGSDIRKEEPVLKKGRVLSSGDVGVLAALGFGEVKVYKRPRVVVLSTGAEIVEPGKPLSPGKIFDVNAYALSAAVLESGGEPIGLGIVLDEERQVKAALERALSLADVVVTSGGVSVGSKDVVPRVLDELGEPGVVICGVAVKPGKPMTVAVIDGKPVFCLPGHPTSALLMFHLFVRPVVWRLAGKGVEVPFVVKAVAAERMFSARGRRTFVMVSLGRDESGRLFAFPVPFGLSGAISTLAKADGFVEILESQQFVSAGDEVVVRLFRWQDSGCFVLPS